MNRRKFIVFGTAALLTIPLYKIKRDYFDKDGLFIPYILSYLSEDQIHSIGKQYILNYPEENTINKLKNLIIKGIDYPKATNNNSVHLHNMLKEKVQKDFKESNVIICNGWIISVTEGRQCALLTLA